MAESALLTGDAAFKRELALKGTIIAALAIIAAATIGTSTLQKWGVSVGALQLTAGIVLFLIALKPVLEQYAPRTVPALPAEDTKPPSASVLAFSPLAFPTIVAPYGVAVVILLFTLRGGNPRNILLISALMALVLGLNFLAMLYADRVLKNSTVAAALGIVGSVMAVLQVALGVDASIDGLRMLGIV